MATKQKAMQKMGAFAETVNIISRNILLGVPVVKVQQGITQEVLEYQKKFVGSRQGFLVVKAVSKIC